MASKLAACATLAKPTGLAKGRSHVELHDVASHLLCLSLSLSNAHTHTLTHTVRHIHTHVPDTYRTLTYAWCAACALSVLPVWRHDTTKAAARGSSRVVRQDVVDGQGQLEVQQKDADVVAQELLRNLPRGAATVLPTTYAYTHVRAPTHRRHMNMYTCTHRPSLAHTSPTTPATCPETLACARGAQTPARTRVRARRCSPAPAAPAAVA